MNENTKNKINALIKAIDKMDDFIKFMDISLYGRICNIRHFNDYKYIGGTKTEDELAQHRQELNVLKHKTIIEDSVTQFLLPLHPRISDIYDASLDFYFDNNDIDAIRNYEQHEDGLPIIISRL